MITGGAYGTSLLTGRRRLRGTSLLTDGGAYGTSLFARRHSQTSLLTNGGASLRAEPGRASLRDGALITGSAYGTSLLTRAGGAYGTSLLTDGGASGTSLLARRHSRTSLLTLTGRVPHGPEALTAYGTSVLTGRRRLRDEPLYRPE